ncbi:MAG: hydantoinase/oxoprolinase family protein, partial [Alphaproteobacteria bacterium]|nr:hydantoinase/oxoprolinase family protein [Alphaproteobacteria bacterium]
MGHVLGIDIGGTFTDFSLVDDRGRITLWKEASTPKDPSQGIKTGLNNLAKARGLSLAAFLNGLDLFVHGSTIATNTVIQRNGPKIGLICTEGFRDVIFLRNGFKPERFNWNLKPPEDFVPRYLRLGVTERIDYKGDVITPLDATSVQQATRALKAENVKAVAVALLWSIVNPAHERMVKELIEREMPGVPVVLSSDVLPAIREWERTCSTLLSAYVLPGISTYLRELERYLKESGLKRPLLIIQLNGGCASVENVLRKPIYALASGPAAGPAAALHCAQRENLSDVIAVDMGGTSFDVCMVTGGQATMTKEMRVEDMPVGVAAVDVHSIGAGGGSIAWVDKGGALQVGPRSAGADPGPACYAQGGAEPTVTDANVVLGYINPDYFLGGRRKIDPALSRAAIERAVAKPLGIGIEEAAQG